LQVGTKIGERLGDIDVGKFSNCGLLPLDATLLELKDCPFHLSESLSLR